MDFSLLMLWTLTYYIPFQLLRFLSYLLTLIWHGTNRANEYLDLTR